MGTLRKKEDLENLSRPRTLIKKNLESLWLRKLKKHEKRKTKKIL
jgi:hypothetical protein